MTTKIDRRQIGKAGLEIRLASAGDEQQAAVIRGHAALFDTLSEDLGGFREKIAAGAFSDSLASDDIRALLNHDSTLILGRTSAGTLRLSEDATGLAFELDPPDTSYGRDLQISMQRGDVSQMSFGFVPVEDHWDKVNGEWIRTLLKVQLFEVSPVTWPAYGDTTAELSQRSRDACAAAIQPPAPDPQDEYRALRLQLARAS